jgi:predicted nucleic acid-binding protein
VKPQELSAPAILVDTDVFSALGEGRPSYEGYRPFTVNRFVFLSFITVAEVLRGAYAAKWGSARLDLLEQGLRAYGVLPGNAGVARTYARPT